MKRRVLVTGCGRSGTYFISETLKRAGVGADHEGLGSDGTVSWYFAPTFHAEGFPNRVHRDLIWPQQVSFETVLLQVRHPLKVIPSLRKALNHLDWSFVRSHISLSTKPLIREMEYWLRWNELALRRNPILVYQVERISENWDSICELLGIPSCPLPKVPTNYNTRGQCEVITWDYLKLADRGLAHKVQTLANQLGYI